ncbi:MAG: helix-turn-helix transcriptional regulator [Pseudomonadota bacterium]
MDSFPDLLRHWRQQRRFSQLDLSLEAGVSARHISFLETGRARPSRDMILHLGDVLSVPLDMRNRMLGAAGFAARYRRSALDADALAPIRQALDWTLDRHAPYPGIAIDGHWVIQRMNDPARHLFGALGLDAGASMIDLILRPDVQAIIENWPEVAHHSAQRLRTESAALGGDDVLDQAARDLAPHAQSPIADTPTVPTVIRLGDMRLSLFATIAQFGTPTDQTVDDLKIELFFPADDQSAATLRALADQR